MEQQALTFSWRHGHAIEADGSQRSIICEAFDAGR
jgi:hypothetical protein